MKPPRQISARVVLEITPHEKPLAEHSATRTLDFSPYVTGAQRSKSLMGDSVGSWSVNLAFDQRQPDARQAERNLLRYVRDDDWGELTFAKVVGGATEEAKTWDVMVVSSGQTGQVSQDNGSIANTYTVSGQDWARCMVQGQFRLSAAFDAGRRVPGAVNGQQWLQAVYAAVNQFRSEGDARLTAQAEQTTTALIKSELPDATDSFVRRAAMTQINPKAASAILRNVLTVLLALTWHHPIEGGLLERMTWERFGPVSGSPWRLAHLANQRVITPDSLLRQFGCLAYNELWYGYVPVAGGGRRMSITYREHPYQRVVWNRLTIRGISGADISARRLGRSGNERFNFWKPQASIGAISGQDLYFTLPEELPSGRRREYRIPIIYDRQIKRHGLRPIEPTDDFMFYAGDPRVQFAKRLKRFSNWMSNNPEMVTGHITLDTIYPSLEIGERVALPIPWSFLLWKGKSGPTSRDPRIVHDADGFDAYVNEISETMRVVETGVMVAETTISITRGQPRGGSFRQGFAKPWEEVDP